MKHPALARVFSVVLAILAAILLAAGIQGYQKVENEYADRLAYEAKFSDRIENYRALRAELADSADYNEVMAALDRFMTEHEKAASKHKTDTAIYSSTKGGLKMGEDMIVAIRAQMNQLRQQLQDANSRKAFLEGLLSELIASQKNKMPWLDALANQAAQYAVDSYMESAKIELVSVKLRVLMDNEPTPESVAAYPFSAPEVFSSPDFPVLPEMGAFSLDTMQAAYQAAASAFMDTAVAYEQAGEAYVQQMQDYYDASARQVTESLNGARRSAMDSIMDAAYSEEYKLAHKAWEEECKSVKAELDLAEPKARMRQLSTALTSIVRQANSLSADLTGELGGIYPGFEELASLAETTAARLDRIAGSDLSELSNEEFLDLADDVQEVYDMLTDAFSAIASNLDNPAALIADLMERLGITKELVKYLNQMLDKADHEMQASLEELWYQLGEAEKKTFELEAEKLGLDKEAELLSKRTLEAEELKDLRNRHASARQLLLNVPEVKARTSEDEQLADNAQAWLDTYAAETQKLHQGKQIILILAVAGGVMGILGIPAAYELIRNRFFLITPVLLCMLCAAGAEALNMAFGLGQHYAALFTAIFALVQLLIVIPKAKKPRHAPQHLKT